ncbi:MAG: hypothetical protein CL910_20110 [Deltaproteobacteria bacterium]|jgi:drug/metabolite transporter (DMT)-like permease|nr:hypothetical protein [Deltaproteobacteria bacterium]
MSYAAALGVGVLAAALGHVLLRRFFLKRSVAMLVLAILAFLVGQVGYYVALLGLDVGVVYMATGLIPAIGLALAHGLLREPANRHQIAAVALIALGVFVYTL